LVVIDFVDPNDAGVVHASEEFYLVEEHILILDGGLGYLLDCAPGFLTSFESGLINGSKSSFSNFLI
jgi:hypothetical protein